MEIIFFNQINLIHCSVVFNCAFHLHAAFVIPSIYIRVCVCLVGEKKKGKNKLLKIECKKAFLT